MTEPNVGEVSLSDQLIDQLQRRIISGEIERGSWLRHASIAEEFGVSRSPVREALRVLHARGVVTIVRNRGARVDGLSPRDIRELGEVRAELEGLACELAVERINDEQLNRLEQAVIDFRAAVAEYAAEPHQALSKEADERWAETNHAFHNTILEAADNRQLAISIDDISRRLPRNANYPAYAGNSRLLQQNVNEHAEIAEAILASDAARARTAMVDHIRSATQLLARTVED